MHVASVQYKYTFLYHVFTVYNVLYIFLYIYTGHFEYRESVIANGISLCSNVSNNFQPLARHGQKARVGRWCDESGDGGGQLLDSWWTPDESWTFNCWLQWIAIECLFLWKYIPTPLTLYQSKYNETFCQIEFALCDSSHGRGPIWPAGVNSFPNQNW